MKTKEYTDAYVWFTLALIEYILESDGVNRREWDILSEAIKDLEKKMSLPDIYVSQYACEKKKVEIANNTSGKMDKML